MRGSEDSGKFPGSRGEGLSYVGGGNLAKIIGHLFITGYPGALMIGSKKFMKPLYPLKRIIS